MRRAWRRRGFLQLTAAASTRLAFAGDPRTADVHEQILQLAARQERTRRARFAAVESKAALEALQATLREGFLRAIGGLPAKAGPPAVKKTGHIEGDDYTVEKLVYESFPGYFVPALLYRPKTPAPPRPAVLSPCGHYPEAKAAADYQVMHINLAKRGFVVLTYDPVGQGERSQFWDRTRGRSRFNLGCGEHEVLGNPLYLLGSNLARFRIWDGVRGIDYLASRPDVDPARIGCVGQSGGGTLTSYIAALDPRVAAAAPCCYITTLPRRMGNRIQTDPNSDPEQDIFGFVGEGIDHAGLLALVAPRPLLLGLSKRDFFPIEGSRETLAEAKHLYEIAGAGDRIASAEAEGPHAMSLTLRETVYRWFDRWLAGRPGPSAAREAPVQPRTAKELAVCAEGQVSVTFASRPLPPLALEQLAPERPLGAVSLRTLLRLDPEASRCELTEMASGRSAKRDLILFVNGNDTPRWQDESLPRVLGERGHGVVVVDPRGVGKLAPHLTRAGAHPAYPWKSVEENIAYNAFLVGKSLVAMRVTDVLTALRRIAGGASRRRIVLCGRRDAAWAATLAAAVAPEVHAVATEELRLDLRSLFGTQGTPVAAASIVPDLLRQIGDVGDVLAAISPRKVLVAAGTGKLARRPASVELAEKPLELGMFTGWLERSV